MSVKKQTVSEFIREVKPDWKPVATREKQATTGAYSGPLQVSMPGASDWTFLDKPCVPESFESQVAAQERQILGEEEPLALRGEETVKVDDFGQETRVVGKIGSQVPR
jgi:hypothetical protein